MSLLKAPPGRVERTRTPWSVISLAVLLGLLAFGSLQGGIAMVMDPVTPLGMSTEFLEGTPVDDYFWPGMFFLGIALASLLAVPGLVLSWDWPWARRIEAKIGFRWPWVAAVAVGTLLLIFEIIELFVIPFHPVMHPLLIASSLAVLALAATPSARRHQASI